MNMYFSLNPIPITLTGITFPQRTTNHRIDLHVTFHRGTSQERTHTFPQTPEGTTAEIDVSSAFQSELQTYPVSPNDYPSSPLVTAHITAEARYLDLDTITEGTLPLTPSETEVQARRGGISTTDLYFHTYVLGDAEHVALTTKPLHATAPVSDASPSDSPGTSPSVSPELVSPGSRLQFGSQTYIVPSTATHGTLIPRSVLYGTDAQGFFQVDAQSQRRTFYFLNSRGEIETIAFASFDTLQQQIKRESLTLSPTRPSLVTPRLKAYTSLSRTSQKFSTGFLSEEWLTWVAQDFLTSEHHWLMTDRGLLPTILTFDETLTVHNHSSQDLTAITFTATTAI